MDAHRRGDRDAVLDFTLLIFHEEVAPLGVLPLAVEDDHQLHPGGMVEHTHLRSAHTGGGGPVDIPDRIAGDIIANTADKKGIRQQRPLRNGLAQQQRQGPGQLVLRQQTRKNHHRHMHLLLMGAQEQPQHVAHGQRRIAQIIRSPVQEPHFVAALHLLIGHHREQTAVVPPPGDLQVLLPAHLQVGGNMALHPQPGDEHRPVVANDLDHLALVTLKKGRTGKSAGALQTAQAEFCQQQSHHGIYRRYRCEDDDHAH